MRESFSGRVREAAQDLGVFHRKDLGDRVGVQDRTGMKRLDNVLKDLGKRGEVERLGPGRYRWRGRERRPQFREIMWRLVRALKAVSVEDLALLTGASRGYAQDWLQLLEKHGLVRREGEKFRLVKEGDMPRNEEKNEYLRHWREQKKTALARLDAALAAVAEARLAVSQMEEE